MQHNEQLRSLETTPTRSGDHRASASQLDTNLVRELYVCQKERLSRLHTRIGAALYSMLEKKITEENSMLISFVELDIRSVERTKKSIKTLDPTYFSQKPLDTSHL